jgi:hypothetical protein
LIIVHWPLLFDPEDGGDMFLQIVRLSANCMTLQRRRPRSSYLDLVLYAVAISVLLNECILPLSNVCDEFLEHIISYSNYGKILWSTTSTLRRWNNIYIYHRYLCGLRDLKKKWKISAIRSENDLAFWQVQNCCGKNDTEVTKSDG